MSCGLNGNPDADGTSAIFLGIGVHTWVGYREEHVVSPDSKLTD